MSSVELPISLARGQSVPGIPDILTQPAGILSTDPRQNRFFHDWTHVYVWYCSSDSHLGDAAAGGCCCGQICRHPSHRQCCRAHIRPAAPPCSFCTPCESLQALQRAQQHAAEAPALSTEKGGRASVTRAQGCKASVHKQSAPSSAAAHQVACTSCCGCCKPCAQHCAPGFAPDHLSADQNHVPSIWHATVSLCRSGLPPGRLALQRQGNCTRSGAPAHGVAQPDGSRGGPSHWRQRGRRGCVQQRRRGC